MPWITRHGTGWRASWREGGAIRHGPTLSTKAQAAASGRQAAVAIAAAKPANPAAIIPWPELVTRYCASRADTTPAHRAKTQATLLRLATDRHWTTAASVTAATCEGLAPFHGRLLRALLRYADQIGQPIDRRALHVRQPTAKRSPTDLITDSHLAALLAEADTIHPADGALLRLVATYGHRAESLIALTVANLGTTGATIIPTLTLTVKSGDLHRHPLLPADAIRLAELAEGRAPTEPLFVGHLGRPWRSGSEVAAWLGHGPGRRHPWPNGRAVGILDLRRRAISGMLAAGVDARTAASITGHRTVSLLLDTYARTNEARQAAAMTAIATQMLPKKVTSP